jgi:AraC-like DNA-binding protein
MLRLDCQHIVSGQRAYSLHIQETAHAWRYPEHSHLGFGDLQVIERGRLQQRINGDEARFGPGDIVLIRPGDRHELWGDGFRFFNLNLPASEWQRLATFIGNGLPLERLVAERTAPRATLGVAERQEILADLAGLIAGESEPEARALLARFLLRWLPLLAPRSAGRPAGTGPAWLEPLLRRIDEGVGRGLTVTDLPRLAGVSQAHLSRSFRRHLGTTPSQHLNRLRVRQAAVQLARSGRDILDIGYGLGFRSPSYFYRLFVRSYGMPPATYRHRHRMPDGQA